MYLAEAETGWAETGLAAAFDGAPAIAQVLALEAWSVDLQRLRPSLEVAVAVHTPLLAVSPLRELPGKALLVRAQQVKPAGYQRRGKALVQLLAALQSPQKCWPDLVALVSEEELAGQR